MSYLLFSSKCTSEMEFERPTMYAGGFKRMVSKMIASVNGKSLMDSNVNSVCAIIVSESGSLQLSSSSMTSSAIVHSSCSFSKGIFFNLLKAKIALRRFFRDAFAKTFVFGDKRHRPR